LAQVVLEAAQPTGVVANRVAILPLDLPWSLLVVELVVVVN
jgi:hypothetical protein